jgi:GDPmannose 4,6-dehydratase
MHAMLLQDEPQDFIIGTGITHSVEELAEAAFAAAGLNWRDHVVTDTAFFRLSEPANLCADASKIATTLRWSPRMTFNELVAMMVGTDPADDSKTELNVKTSGQELFTPGAT